MTEAEPVTGRRWRASGRGQGRSSWAVWLTVWMGVALVIRVAAVLGRLRRPAGGDAFFYHAAANLLVDGKGWINPFPYYHEHVSLPSAAFPPGFVLVLAAASLVGFKSYLAHRIWASVIGAVAVGVCGRAGREIAGPRVGLITAMVLAVYPNIWMSDEMAMSETLTPLLVGLVLLTAYRFWRRPSLRSAVWLGLAEGVAAISRDELALLGLLIVVPVILTARTITWRRRGAALGVAGLCAVLLVAPWVGYNLSRFHDPVFISTGLGPTLASSNCNATYYGPHEAYWSRTCAVQAVTRPTTEESEVASEQQSYALHYISTHMHRFIPVNLAKLGRGFGLFHPIQQIHLDSLIETRPYHWALLGLWMYYVMVALSVGGCVLLRRRRVPTFPLLAVGATVAFAMLLSFGNTRYRTAFEVSLAILSSVVVDAVWGGLATRRTPAAGTGTQAAEEREATVGSVAG